MFSLITRRDHRLMHRANKWVSPRWVRISVVGATRAGDGWLWYAMGLAILLFGGETRFERLAPASVASALKSLLFLGLRRLTARGVPSRIRPHLWSTRLPTYH